uniref:Uncharacterized protein n=1 Tax=Mola mola TaxID=94237 RepID=A0A3Q4B1U5_MOLML
MAPQCPNTTDTPREAGDELTMQSDGVAGGDKGKEEAENPNSQFSGFVQLWAGLQPSLCGNNRLVGRKRP